MGYTTGMEIMLDEKSVKPVVSVRLEKLRRKSGLSQQALADKLGVSRATINRIEGGLVLPETLLLFSLADFFDVPADYFRTISEESEKKCYFSLDSM